ncbi:hypothetical protein [Vibrio sp.]|uniref:hypothetical protein n=1 Tax=Vibrio sp. TaxID=678 RepID=UPI003D1415F2
MNQTLPTTEFPLCCPLCESDEFLISEQGDKMLCARCGSFLDNLQQMEACLHKVHSLTPSTFIHTTPVNVQ